jgi:hypothetical protein
MSPVIEDYRIQGPENNYKVNRMGIESIKVKKNSTSIISAERDKISCEELAKSTNVTTEVAGDKELRLNNVERERTTHAQVTNSQLVI